MKLALKPTVTAVLLALSGQGITSDFEVVKRKDIKAVSHEQSSHHKTLKLNAAEFDPVYEKMRLPELEENSKTLSQYGLVQFFQNDKNAANRIVSLGAKIVSYLPHDTYVVHWDKTVKSKLTQSNDFRFVGDYKNAYKLSPTLWNTLKSLDKESHQSLIIEMVGFKGTKLNELNKLLQKYSPNAAIQFSKTIDDTPFVRLKIDSQIKQTVMKLLQSGQVMWVDKYLPVKIRNIDSVGPIQSDSPDITDATI